MIADLLILLALLVGVFIGLSRGLIGPLATEGAFLIAFYLAVHVHGLYDGFLPVGWPRAAFVVVFVVLGTVLLRLLARPLVAIWRGIPLLRIIDAPAGAAGHALAVFVLIYLGLGLVLDFDHGVYPLVKTAVATANAIDGYRRAVRDQPLLSGLINDQVLKQLAQQAGPSPLPISQVQQTEGFLSFYERYVRTPLSTSKLAPVINRLGSRLPLIGHNRPYLAGTQVALRLATGALP